jgi:hypothetical protein
MTANLSEASCAAALGLLFLCCGCADSQHAKHQPASSYSGVTIANSAESKAVLNALPDKNAAAFQIHHFKVHGDWAWVDVTPLNKSGKPIAEGGPRLLHRMNGDWKQLDLSKVPDDPKDPLGAENASPGFVKNVQQTYPGVPREIFPKPSHH